MDQAALVEGQFNDGQKLFDRFAEEGMAVAAAWVKEYDAWQWYLYLVTPLVGEDGDTTAAYRKVHAVYRAMPEPLRVDLFQIKVVGPSEPVGQAILALRRRSVGRGPVEYAGPRLGDVSVDAAYIYPPSMMAARQ